MKELDALSSKYLLKIWFGLQHANQLHCSVLSKGFAKNPIDAPSCLLRTLGHGTHQSSCAIVPFSVCDSLYL